MNACSSLISLFVPSLGGGGAERVMTSLAAGFAARGRQVELVTCNSSGPYAHLLPPSVVVSLPQRRMSRVVPALAGYLLTRRPAVLLSAMSHCNVAAIAAMTLSGCRSRVLVSEHSNLVTSLNALPWLKARLLHAAMKATYGLASGVVAVSRGVGESLVEARVITPQSVTVIGNPIVDQRLKSAADEPPAHPWCHDRSVPLIVSAGRLTEAKDFGTLLRAFSLVRQTHLARLLIVGEGEQRARLTRLIVSLGLQESVAMPGFVLNPYSHMRAAAVFVLSSRWEGFGNVLVEAMASGVPVVSTDCPSGPSEILENGRWGRLVSVGDHVALAQGIIDGLEARVPFATERADDFSVSAAVDKYLSLIDRVY